MVNDSKLIITNDLGLDYDADFASCLNCKGACNTLKGIGNFLKLFKTLNVILNIFATCTGTCSRNGISRLNNKRNCSFGFYVTVVSMNCMNNCFAFLVFLCGFNTQLNMRTFKLVINSLSDIMRMTCALCMSNIGVKLCCKQT